MISTSPRTRLFHSCFTGTGCTGVLCCYHCAKHLRLSALMPANTYIHVFCQAAATKTLDSWEIDRWLHAPRPAHFHPISHSGNHQSLRGPACDANGPKWHRPCGPERALPNSHSSGQLASQGTDGLGVHKDETFHQNSSYAVKKEKKKKKKKRPT